jgi:hypothetical protein
VMSDGVMAAIIAACATVFASFIQIRASFAKEVAGRAFPGGGRRKSRKPLVFVFMMLGGSAVGGFALSQWLMEHERSMQSALVEQLRSQITSLTRSESELSESRAGTRAEIEASLMRKVGLEGVVATATVGPCKPPLVLNSPALTGQQPETSDPPSPSSCTEAEAMPVTMCAIVPVGATITEVAVFMKPTDSDMSWSNARLVPGAETAQARFAEKPVEVADSATTKQVCETFVSWSMESSRTARMLVRYSL